MNAYNTYAQTQTETANPGELVVMLYRGAARFVTKAVVGLEANDKQTASNNLIFAQNIITELSNTLDLERGGDLAKKLVQIYEYMNHRLVQANLGKDPEPARDVERLLRELLPAWEQAARETGPTAAPRSLALVA